MTILNYPGKRRVKPRALVIEPLKSEEEAAIYDLIFNNIPLRVVGNRINLSYQGVYIRALAYMQMWQRLGFLKLDSDYIKSLFDAYEESKLDETKKEGEARMINKKT